MQGRGCARIVVVFCLTACGCGDDGTSTGAGGASTGTSGGGQGQGGGGGLPTDCAPTEGVGIPETCGVFVKSGGSGDGSQGSPFGTVVEASTSTGSVQFAGGGGARTATIR